MFLSIGMLKQKYFLADIFILSAEKQPIKLSWRKIECLQFDAYKYTDTKCFFVVSLMFFVLFNILVLPAIFLTFTGIAFSVALCLLLSHYRTRLFSSFRDYTFQIFLMGLFFQMGIRFLYVKLDNELLYWPLYVLSILLALYMPVLISKMIRKIESPFIHQCFGL